MNNDIEGIPNDGDVAESYHLTDPLLTAASSVDNYHYYAVLLAAISLVASGSASEGAQAMYAECTTFDYENFIAEFFTNNNALESFSLALIIIGAASTAIQSACLEFSYTLDFLKDPRTLFSTSNDSDFKLNPYQKIALATTIILGASVRGIISIMGYYAINGNLSTLAKAFIYASSAIDVVLTMATDGTYLKNNYLWLRSKNTDSNSRQELTTLFQATHGESNPILSSQKSQVAFYSTFFLGTLAVSGEVGLAALALKQFIDKGNAEPSDTANGLITTLMVFSLIGFFALLTASDTLTFAKKMAVYCESDTLSNTDTPLTKPCCTNLTTAMAAFISIAGAAVRTIGTFGGTQHLAELCKLNKTHPGVMVVSALFGGIRAGQCLSLEGMATIQASSSWCTWFKTDAYALLNNHPILLPNDCLEQDNRSFGIQTNLVSIQHLRAGNPR